MWCSTAVESCLHKPGLKGQIATLVASDIKPIFHPLSQVDMMDIEGAMDAVVSGQEGDNGCGSYGQRMGCKGAMGAV